MKTNLFITAIVLWSLSSCTKTIEKIAVNNMKVELAPVKTAADFVTYTIKKGEQFCDKNNYTMVKYEQLKFIVKFDSSAIYETIRTGNQTDINKLFGFSDNNKAHHEFSARFGWRWSNNALRIFSYVYNNSVMSCKELGTIQIGTENTCTIKVSGTNYIFGLNEKTETIPRASTTAVAEGYKLYPYFGGDELAPHQIVISIKEL